MTLVETPRPSPESTPDALRRLVGLRYAIAALLAAALLTIRFVFDIPLPLAPTLGALVALLLINGLLHRRVSKRRRVSERQLFISLTAEALALTWFLYFAGGSTNPLVSLYLLPLTMAANLLERRLTWALTLITVLCYTSLLVGYVGLDPHAGHGDAGTTPFGLHVLGMWVIFVVSAVLVAHYVSSMAQALRERDRQLAQAREDALRNERIVALGTVSAGAAHEFGTPLAIMSVLAEDMARRYTQPDELADDVADLQTEIAKCKRILSALTEVTGSTRGEGGGPEAADRFLARTFDRWRHLRPAAQATLHWADPAPAPALVADRTLEQALLNLLNNAADASPDGFEVAGHADGDNVVIDILDRGPGLTSEIQARAGELFFSTKGPAGGMGIGLFLANATIQRFGGSVRLFNRSDGGACTRVKLPFLSETPAVEHP